MATIDIERLGVLLDRGADVAAAARQASTNLAEANEAVKHHEGTTEELAALRARVARRLAEHDAAAHRATAWANHCNALRAFAKKHGVSL